MWKNTVESDRPPMKIRRMRIACWILKATDIQSEYVIIIALTPQQWLQERAPRSRYTYIACIVKSQALDNWRSGKPNVTKPNVREPNVRKPNVRKPDVNNVSILTRYRTSKS